MCPLCRREISVESLLSVPDEHVSNEKENQTAKSVDDNDEWQTSVKVI